MKPTQKPVQRTWYRAKLTPMSASVYTDAFYPEPKRGTGAQIVFFTQVDITQNASKVIVASRLSESGVRMMTRDLAQKCLIPMSKATKAEMDQLNVLSANLKV